MLGLGHQHQTSWVGGMLTSGTSPSLSWYNCVAMLRRRHPLCTGKHKQEEECGYLPLREPGSLQQLQAPDFLLKRLSSLYSHSPCSANCLLRHSVPDLSSQPLGDTVSADNYTLVHIKKHIVSSFQLRIFQQWIISPSLPCGTTWTRPLVKLLGLLHFYPIGV